MQTRRVLDEEVRPVPEHNVSEDHVHREEDTHDEERVDVARASLPLGVDQKVGLGG